MPYCGATNAQMIIIEFKEVNPMGDLTEKNLAYAFAAESKAAIRNDAFAKKAEAEGYTQSRTCFAPFPMQNRSMHAGICN